MTRLVAAASTLWLAASVFAAAEHQSRLRPWNDYRTIMWVGDTAFRQPSRFPVLVRRLREMGINTGMVYGDASPQPWLEHDFPYYVENVINKGLCLKFNSKVRDWDKFVTDWARNGRPESAFVRDYCLDDPGWQDWSRGQMRKVASRHAPYAPLAYDIRDELSVTISANPFDFDYSPATLRAFRAWLQSQYPTIDALNVQWQSAFATWDEVIPFSTDQIKHRMITGEALPRGKPDWQALQRLKFEPAQARKELRRWNFSPWCDFRSYMDYSLARELNALRAVSHAADPATPVGIEGTQMPSAWGGYDLWRLSQSLDWVEPYDIGNAREILGSFMPGKPILATVFESDTPRAMRRLWHLLLEGDRGCIIWWSEDCFNWTSTNLLLTAKAKALAPALRELTSPLARLFLLARKEYDPIGILYSHPSIQVNWLLESTGDGSTWPRRFSSHEASHNRMARVRNAWLKGLQDVGYAPRFIAAPKLSNETALRGLACFVLPTALALSSNECRLLLEFAAKSTSTEPRVILADGTPGLFDEHGRLRSASPFEKLVRAGASEEFCWAGDERNLQPGDLAPFAAARLSGTADSGWTRWLERHTAHVPREVTLATATRTRIHRFVLGQARLLAFERNIDYQMSEDLKQAGGNEALEQPVEIEATLAQPAHVYDLRARRYLGRSNRIAFRLDPWQPSLFALLSEPRDPARLIDDLLAARLAAGKEETP